MPVERQATIDAFLRRAGWQDARATPIAGDASSRRYTRLRREGGDTAVLMDAPGRAALERFVAVDAHLLSLGLSAPRILARDLGAGLLLIEDFGEARYPELLVASPEAEARLFEAATDVLVALHTGRILPGPDLGPATLTDQAGLAYESYLPATTGVVASLAQKEMQSLLGAAFAALTPRPPGLVHRDYHAGNLFWLEGRSGAARVGLIDFQDAGLGHPLYDLVSLARDARRVVAPEIVAAMRARFAAATGIDDPAAWALLAAQRNLRILGIFARLALDHAKPFYLDFLPRTWALMEEDLEHPSLTRLKARLLADLPPPTPDLIASLKARCPAPTP